MTISPQFLLSRKSPLGEHAPDMETNNELSISVVIAAHTEERWDYIVEAVESVQSQSPAPLEVILAVDHNRTLADRARAQLAGVTVVESDGRKGASGARNAGVKRSRGELIAFLDDDQVAEPGWLFLLSKHFHSQNVLGVGGGVMPDWTSERPEWLPREFDWTVGCSYIGQPEAAAPVRNVWSGNMAIRRSVFDAVEGFRPEFGKVGNVSRPEDTDFCLRVQQAFPTGHWLYEPAAQALHKVPSDRTTRSYFLKRCWNEGRGKAALARLNGLGNSTATERRYMTQVLPGALLRELRTAISRLDGASLQRCAAILSGLVATAAGLVTEVVTGAVRRTSGRAPVNGDGSAFRPVQIGEWDVLMPFPAGPRNGPHFDTGPVQMLVRMASEPLGWMTLECGDPSALPGEAAQAVWLWFGPEINARLLADGLGEIGEVPVEGLPMEAGQLAFMRERNRLLENAPLISIILCTRDRPDRLAHCVRQLSRLEYPNYEILVVDNAPADPEAVPAALAALGQPVPVRYLLESRGGISWARNTGCRNAKGDILAFIDDDEVPDEYWLREILRGFSAAPDVGCVSGVILPAELKTQAQAWFEEFGGHSKGRGFGREVFGPGHAQSPLYPLPPFGTGANMAFRREVLAEIGGFHVALGVGTPTRGSEDTYAFTRALLGGHTMVYQPTALTWHYHRETVGDLKKQLRGYGTGTMAFYMALLCYRPSLLAGLLKLIPQALGDLRGKDSPRTAMVDSFPRSFLRTELVGMLQGVPAYLRSVLEQQRKRRLGAHPALKDSARQ